MGGQRTFARLRDGPSKTAAPRRMIARSLKFEEGVAVNAREPVRFADSDPGVEMHSDLPLQAANNLPVARRAAAEDEKLMA